MKTARRRRFGAEMARLKGTVYLTPALRHFECELPRLKDPPQPQTARHCYSRVSQRACADGCDQAMAHRIQQRALN